MLSECAVVSKAFFQREALSGPLGILEFGSPAFEEYQPDWSIHLILLNIYMFLAHQILPVVSRLVEPIEGTDNARVSAMARNNRTC